jgi:hypothetical protein
VKSKRWPSAQSKKAIEQNEPGEPIDQSSLQATSRAVKARNRFFPRIPKRYIDPEGVANGVAGVEFCL